VLFTRMQILIGKAADEASAALMEGDTAMGSSSTTRKCIEEAELSAVSERGRWHLLLLA
jgi:hypothetical protein